MSKPDESFVQAMMGAKPISELGLQEKQTPPAGGEGGAGAGAAGAGGAGDGKGGEGGGAGAGAGAGSGAGNGGGAAAAGAAGTQQQQQAAGGSSASPNPGDAGAGGGKSEEDDFVDIKELFGGKYESVDDLIKDYEKLQNEKNNPQFKSEKQRLLYEFGSQIEGMELDRARQLLEVVSLDLKSAPDQRIRFEAFKLDPSNKGLSHDELVSLFEQEELERFGNPTEENGQTDVQKIRAKQATATAREKLSKLQEEWQSAKGAEESPEEVAEKIAKYQKVVESSLSDFDGLDLKMSFDEDGKKVEGSVNFKFLNPEQKKSVIQAVSDPEGWMAEKLFSRGIFDKNNPNNPPDMKKFAQFVTEIEYGATLRELSYKQGRNDKFAEELAKKRNADPGAGGGGAPPDPTKGEDKGPAYAAAKAAGFI